VSSVPNPVGPSMGTFSAEINEHGETAAAPPTVLLVEDDDRIAGFIIKGLRASNFVTEWLTTGAEALSRIAAGGVDVQVLDLGLPDMDGLDVMRHLNAHGKTPPTVVVTARTDPRDRQAALELGVRTYITKPFPFANLVAAVRECIAEPGRRAPSSRTGSAGNP
jgi:DNA-binding response OmpR family regulator